MSQLSNKCGMPLLIYYTDREKINYALRIRIKIKKKMETIASELQYLLGITFLPFSSFAALLTHISKIFRVLRYKNKNKPSKRINVYIYLYIPYFYIDYISGSLFISNIYCVEFINKLIFICVIMCYRYK